MTRLVPFLLVLAAAGCAPYTDAQLALITQARRGLTLVEQAHAERAELVARHHLLSREQVDRAFDDDVRNQAALDAAWVIDHRRAYAAAMDALAQQRAASSESDAATIANLRAIALSLSRLESLVSLPSRLISSPELRHEQD